MDIGFVGLGRMGANMVERLLRGGHRVVAFNRSPEKTHAVVEKGAEGAFSLSELVSKLTPPRTIWAMVPSGSATEATVLELSHLLSAGDLVVDGGNSRYTDSVRRAGILAGKGLRFMDAGTSGGIWGLENGYCLMVGGTPEDYHRLEPALKTLAPNAEGVLHAGPVGAGHFTKMVHNGIEYALMQGYAEGFEILRAAPFPLDLGRISHLWNQASVVRSWLLELAERAFAKDPDLAAIKDYVEDSGEGRWTVEQAIQTGVPADAIAHALFARFASRQEESFAGKVLAALRNEFGGHAVKAK
ncbi:MAG: decarboxylating 6-phosphogluconate dehydrogenase [Elusimicrobia bacterium]|nr:decarboxylating 6-phosphogluconate dehydrogenase [Elusimicrobiota bacterium]